MLSVDPLMSLRGFSLQSSIFWAITLCGQLQVDQRFRRTCFINLALYCYLLQAGLLFDSVFDPAPHVTHVPPRRLLTFEELHRVISQATDRVLETIQGTGHERLQKTCSGYQNHLGSAVGPNRSLTTGECDSKNGNGPFGSGGKQLR
jgi:hypothetical protein